MSARNRTPRRVLLMTDYFASPIWSPDRSTSLGLDFIPASEELKADLAEWARRYDRLADTDFEWSSPADQQRFDVDGRALWQRVREELGPEWEVGYLGEFEDEAVWPGPGPDDA